LKRIEVREFANLLAGFITLGSPSAMRVPATRLSLVIISFPEIDMTSPGSTQILKFPRIRTGTRTLVIELSTSSNLVLAKNEVEGFFSCEP
jgi:hypothetical protein